MPKPVVFISHITDEAQLAALVKSHIQKAFIGMIDVFVSSDGESIQPGREWFDRIKANLRTAEVMLILCSQQSVKRPWINFEAGAAWGREIYAVPICHTNLTRDNLSAPLNQLQGINADNERHWGNVYQVLAEKLGSNIPPADFSSFVKDIKAFEEENLARIAKKEQEKLPVPTVNGGTSLVDAAPETQDPQPFNPNYDANILMEWVVDELDRLNPEYSAGSDHIAQFREALEQSIPLVVRFAEQVREIARKHPESALGVYKGFEAILNRYDSLGAPKANYWHIDGHPIDYDFYKFLGHELFVTFISFLIKEEQWALIGGLLEEDFYINNGLNPEPHLETFEYAYQWVKMCAAIGPNNYISPQGEILARRHKSPDLEGIVPLQQFMEADLFLFLHRNKLGEQNQWYPVSTVYLHSVPRYLVMAQQVRFANQLLQPLGVASIDILRDRLIEAKQEYTRLFGHRIRANALGQIDVAKIGSR